MIHCIFGSKGGVGTSTITQGLAYNQDGKILLIDASFREKAQDLLNGVESSNAFDFYDFLSDRGEREDCIIELVNKKLDLITASSIHRIDEVEEDNFIEKIEELKKLYDTIYVDLSRWWIDDLKYWSKVADHFTLVFTSENLSLRGLDKFNFFCFREKITTEKRYLLNKVKNMNELEKIKNWNQEQNYSIHGYIEYLDLKEENIPILDIELMKDFEMFQAKKENKSWLRSLFGGKK